MRFKIAGVQMPVGNDIEVNEKHILGAIQQAARDQADLLLTPEGSLSGYTPHFDGVSLRAALERVTAAAKAARVGLALGTCYEEADKVRYNEVRVYTPDGEYRGFHAKILRCSSLDAPGTGEMADYGLAPLRTFQWKETVFGALICNDLWAAPAWTTFPNPYLPWRLKLKGARFILHAVNSGEGQQYRPFHESSVALWARALQVPIVEANASPENGPVNASSGVMDPKGDWLVKVPDTGYQYFCREIDV